MNIFDSIIYDIQENDFDDEFQRHINFLSSKHDCLIKFATAEPFLSEDNNIVESLDAIVKVCNYIEKQHKTAGMIQNVTIKALKVAETVLSTLLLRDPIRVGIAYTALHKVIKELEREQKEKK